MKDKIIVAIMNSNTITNINDLPPVFSNDNFTVITHRSPKAEIIDNELVLNFDYLIEGVVTGQINDTVLGVTWEELLPSDKRIQSVRVSKSIMQNELATFKSAVAKGFLPVPTYVTSLSGRGLTKNLDYDRTYVLKTDHGARGVGHIVFCPGKVSLEVLLHKLNMAETVEEFLTGVEGIPNGDTVIYATGKENSPGESFSLLRGSNLLIQEQIHGISAEYRVLVRPEQHGNEYIVYKRSRDTTFSAADGEFSQATGVDNGILSQKTLGEHTAEFFNMLAGMDSVDEFKKIVTFLLNKYSPIISLDVFVQQTPEGTKWGIFEHSNQFGVIGPGECVANLFTQDAILECIRRRVKPKEL